MEEYLVTLSTEERLELEHLVSAGKSAARKLTHARILLLADTSSGKAHADTEVVAALGTGLRTVERVRKRLVTQGLPSALDHNPRPPRPDKIKVKGNVEQKLVRLACGDPPEGRCRWALQSLADELVVLGQADAISIETVRAALQKTTFSPGSSRRGASRRR